MEGLSAKELTIRVHSPGEDMGGEGDLVIWSTRDATRGHWKEGQALYTFAQNHTVRIEMYFKF